MPTSLARRQLELRYQPIVDLSRGEVVALEVLLQRRDPGHGSLPSLVSAPDELDVIAGMLDEACRQAQAWQRQGLAVDIGVNASPAQTALPGFLGVVRRCLMSSGLPASRLTVEVVEPGPVEQASAAAGLRELAALGVTVALDDFGTGHGSLMHLRRYPVDQLKIDRSFVRGLGRSPDDDAIVSSIVSLGRALDVTCVAQGVVTADQVTRLLELGCARAQGALFSAPVPAAQVPAAIDAAERCTAARLPQPAGTRLPAPGPAPEDVRQMQQMWDAGASHQTIAAAMNRSGSRHPLGRQWHRTSVAHVLAEASASQPVSA